MMLHVSTFSWRRKVVTPDSFSPLIIAQLIGAAPRYFGNSEACKLNAPFIGTENTLGGKMRNATTTKRSGAYDVSELQKESSRNDSGCSSDKECLSAKS